MARGNSLDSSDQVSAGDKRASKSHLYSNIFAIAVGIVPAPLLLNKNFSSMPDADTMTWGEEGQERGGDEEEEREGFSTILL